MSVALTKHQLGKEAINKALPWAGMGLCLAILIGHLAYDLLGRSHLHAAVGTAESDAAGAKTPSTTAPPASKTTVKLTDSKYTEAKITNEPARMERLVTEVGVTGMIDANSNKKVDVRPRASGIVGEVRVVLGQPVKKGDLLVTLDSPDIGTARLNLRAKQRELSTARFEARWKSEIAANVALLIPELRRGIEQRRADVADDEDHAEGNAHEPAKATDPKLGLRVEARLIEKQFANKPLGSYRGTLLQAYAEFDIASHEEQKTASLRKQNVVGEHPALVARHTREGIQAKLEAAIEQVRYDAAQEKRLADQAVRLAESAVIDAAQRLRILGVSEDIRSLLEHADQADKLIMDENVTYYSIVAPFDGTIIKRSAVPSQKADSSDILFTLADLRSVWVTANVSESDVAKLPKIKAGTIRFTATSYPKQEFTARILSVGAVVDPQTRTLPLLAEADNPGDLLKPNMFVQILLDSTASEQALTVPASAVIEIETEKYVFVPAGKGPANRAFTLRPVETGRQFGDRVVVKSGLTPGTEIVATGAYLLKSELILQNETDEE
jgi:membrane fusion protein, heavy metal efflux system